MAHTLTATWSKSSTYNYIKVNGTKVDLPYTLKNGDVVEIYTINGDYAALRLNGNEFQSNTGGTLELNDTNIDYTETSYGPIAPGQDNFLAVTINYSEATVSYPKINSFTYHGKQIKTINGKNIRYVHYGDKTYEMVYDEPTEDALAGTWVFNDKLNPGLSLFAPEPLFYLSYSLIPNLSESAQINVNFSNNGVDYVGIIYDLNVYYTFPPNIPSEALTVYSDTVEGGHWHGEEYKTITITSKLSEVTNGQTLLTWLQANATKQGATTPALISFTIAGTSYQAEEGMTWAEWVESSYNTGGFYVHNNRIGSTGTNFISTKNAPSTEYAEYSTNVITKEMTYYLPSISPKPPVGGGGGVEP